MTTPIALHRRVLDVPTVIYLVLAAATVFSWFIGTEEATSHETLVGSVVILIAFVKLRLVGIHFMEIGDAPRALRVVFEAYVLATFVVTVTLYLLV
jgi:hypothetical protein